MPLLEEYKFFFTTVRTSCYGSEEGIFSTYSDPEFDVCRFLSLIGFCDLILLVFLEFGYFLRPGRISIFLTSDPVLLTFN